MKKRWTLCIASAALLVTVNSSDAGVCQSYEAAYNIDVYIGTGMDLSAALQTVIDEEYSDGSQGCWKSIKKEITREPQIFPDAYKAIYKKMPNR